MISHITHLWKQRPTGKALRYRLVQWACLGCAVLSTYYLLFVTTSTTLIIFVPPFAFLVFSMAGLLVRGPKPLSHLRAATFFFLLPANILAFGGVAEHGAPTSIGAWLGFSYLFMAGGSLFFLLYYVATGAWIIGQKAKKRPTVGQSPAKTTRKRK